ncbi:xylan 1,4-beta-xylosidase [Streptomyces sp. NPDC004647]|uniref:xylan 1,4-beta-xylosidase n=1 Tax=Streptomyces sp. NPDC004647 TaxID=3154671 RepID=UPI0033A7649A
MTRHGGARGTLPGAGRFGVTALLGVGIAALALLFTMCGAPPGGSEPYRGSKGATGAYGTPSVPSGKARAELGWGFTHTEFSADDGEPAAGSRAEKLLSAQPMPQNQHIMGWGADNPEPSPGRYDFAELDRRIAFVRRSGGTPVITLCCAPDWMKGGKAGRTDWSKERLETAPAPEHYEDFAALAATVARRYPDVRHFIVWNEFKGFFDESRKRWNYEGYTRLYNLVHAALKKVSKDILVGGPYVVMDSHPPGEDTYASGLSGPWGTADRRSLEAVTYWNEHKAGADFVVVDGSSYTRDDRLIPDEFAATDKLAAVGRWVRRTTGLPLWWAEWYVEPGDERDERDGWSERHRSAVQAAGVIAMARGGATTGFYWNPQKKGERCAGCLWRSTELADGGSGLPMLKLLSRFAREFPPGTRFRDVSVAADDKRNLKVLADDKAVLVVNTLDRKIAAKVDGHSFDLGPYGLRWLTR